ncbi:hypothetical protein LSUE1_G000924 [Lachnellula suecica]|uniref:Uncharacterized protein n=1 Tax=Lachnellula suecica TaxID=602035 RepID=A0A8T9CFW6_9HELO|nr:hypothetical protein LSUE1_G000924 [Lachnellula suecica]
MSYYRDDTITRDGFSCSYGRFCAEPGRVERVQGSSLQSMFLPSINAEGRKRLRESGYLVRGHLKHYGVQFDEKETSGNGTSLMKKGLLAGECDQVPEPLNKLREQMHTEWLESLTPRKTFRLSRVGHGQTITVVGIPLDRHSTYRAGQMRDAASKVSGLHLETSRGPKTQTIFMGWDSTAVSKAAKGHGAKEAEELQATEDERVGERLELHTDYLKTLKRTKTGKKYSPVGKYIIDCEEIESQWPDQADDLGLDIHQTNKPGIFEASFDFGILEGVMMISLENNTLEQYCSQLDRDDESDGDEGGEDEVKMRRRMRLRISKSLPQALKGKLKLHAAEVAHQKSPRLKLHAAAVAHPKSPRLKVPCNVFTN